MVRQASVLLIATMMASAALAQNATQQVSDAKLKELRATYAKAKKSYTAKPKDVKAKKALVNASFAVGMGCMYSESLPARSKYKEALTFFRETLKLDPKHKQAAEQKKLIEDIYKSMGRPVPGGK
jgi:GH24 family phage-related lysozyme (muramidase)